MTSIELKSKLTHKHHKTVNKKKKYDDGFESKVCVEHESSFIPLMT